MKTLKNFCAVLTLIFALSGFAFADEVVPPKPGQIDTAPKVTQPIPVPEEPDTNVLLNEIALAILRGFFSIL